MANESAKSCAEQLTREGVTMIQYAALLASGTANSNDLRNALKASIDTLNYWYNELLAPLPIKGKNNVTKIR
jgi:hypothetical protein